jgi:hypothetical protein
MLSSKPIVAVGAEHPLEDEILMADYFRKPIHPGRFLMYSSQSNLDGIDGLAGVHTSVRHSSNS